MAAGGATLSSAIDSVLAQYQSRLLRGRYNWTFSGRFGAFAARSNQR